MSQGHGLPLIGISVELQCQLCGGVAHAPILEEMPTSFFKSRTSCPTIIKGSFLRGCLPSAFEVACPLPSRLLFDIALRLRLPFDL